MGLPAYCRFTHPGVGYRPVIASLVSNPVPKALPCRIYYPRVIAGIIGSSRACWACQRRMKPWRLMFPQSTRQIGTDPRTAGTSSQLGSRVDGSLPSQKYHLNLQSLADRPHGKFLSRLGSLVTDMAGGNRFQGD